MTPSGGSYSGRGEFPHSPLTAFSIEPLEESMFCECGVTLMGDPDEGNGLCGVCASAPHHRACPCDECEAYWTRIAEESRLAADRANRRLVCSCGWTGAFIEHHNSEAYGPVARTGCEITHREPTNDPQREALRKVWTGSEWTQAGESSGPGVDPTGARGTL